MKQKKCSILIFIILSITILITLQFILRVNAQEKTIQDLTYRLDQLEIPVVEIKIISEQPFQIEITLQSASEDGNATVDDSLEPGYGTAAGKSGK